MQLKNLGLGWCCLGLVLSGSVWAADSLSDANSNQTVSASASTGAGTGAGASAESLDKALGNFKNSAQVLIGELKNSTQSTFDETRKNAEAVLKDTKESLSATLDETSKKVSASTTETLNYLSQASLDLAKSLKGKTTREQQAIVNLDNSLRQMDSFAATFNQEVYNDKGEVLARSSGDLALQRPSQFVMNTLEPDKVVLYTHEGDLYYFDDAVNQVTIYSMNKLQNNPFLLLIEQQNSVWDDFTVSQDEDRYTLVPKESQDIRSLTLSFAPYTLKDSEGNPHRVLDSITIRMNDGNTNFYRFAGHKVEVNPSRFDVVLPSNVDYNDERN